MKRALTYILLFLIFSILFVLPAILFPLPLPQQQQSAVEPLRLLALLLVDYFCLIYLINRIDLHGKELFIAVLVVFWGLQTFMTQIETWYFREAMPAITDEILLKLFMNPLITVVTFLPAGIGMLGKMRQKNNHEVRPLDLKSKWKPLLTLSVAYVFIYFLFGYYIAWQFTEVRTFYSGSPELLGFFDQFQTTLQLHSLIVPFQIVRGFLWILAGLPVILYLKGSRAEKVVACVFMYAVLTCIQLIIDNPFMPAGVRIAHLWEVGTSNGLYGLLVGLVLSRRTTTEAITYS